ncbi:ketopantoate reductase PanE/ApbA C terminal-domain-containing protein [Aspergillus egyptiacus]|nr:ketopantoate reductase PanE/ApbA C terminal-domain-containing protein [Aspergillus egyptiacus]
MSGVRPLLRTAALELSGARGRTFPQVCPSRPASTWMQDVDEATGDHSRRLHGRIHILGVGNVGTFVAHSLASRPSPPPITLLLHRDEVYSSWLASKERLTMFLNGLNDVKTGFDVNVLHNGIWRSPPARGEENELPAKNQSTLRRRREQIADTLHAEEDNQDIECLVVSVKAPATTTALKSIRHRLTPDSTVLFLQNGMGTIEEVNKEVFPDPAERPHYMSGIISHGLARMKDPFHVQHTGVGTTILGPVLSRDSRASATHDEEPNWAPSTKYLLRTLTLTPPLVAVAEPPSSVLLYQLEKLAMNSIINPLTALLNCRNGDLLYNYSITRVTRLLLFEISNVICNLPELQGIPGIESRFSPERLRSMVTQLAQKTAQNHSSMLQDVRARKITEIEYLNGYIVRRGEELGIKCVVNYMLKHLVLAKDQGLQQEELAAIPFDIPGGGKERS